jgi:hypothetical protein
LSISSATDSSVRWTFALTLAGAAIVVACADSSNTRRADSAAVVDSIPPAPTRTIGGNRVAGILFDPMSVRRGDRIGELTLDSIEVRTAHDSTRVGTARFSGPLTLTGRAIRHFDSDATEPCFEADSASAAKLPRWRGDERRAWFCFENQAEARRALGPVSDSSEKSIVIDRFTTHRGMSDEVNSARFVRVGLMGF